MNPENRHPLSLAALAACVLLIVLPVLAQEDEEEAPPPTVVRSSGMAILESENGTRALPVAFGPAGPLFALAPIAEQLGVELRVGPLAVSHTLVLHDRTVILGPDSPVAVVRRSDGKEELLTLSATPAKTAEGLKVPLDFFERTIGDALTYDFFWNAPAQRLTVARRQQRELFGTLLRIRQGRVTTVQITFSERPRYRVEQLATGPEIRLMGDRLTLERNDQDDSDPLVEGIIATPEYLRVLLAPGAAAATPRLLDDPPRLIVEVFQRTESAEPPPPPPPRSADRTGRLSTIVIDPGHGGAETGALGRGGLVEKDLTLWFARALRRRLLDRLPAQVLLTRDDDVEMPLDSRTAFANENKADLFISLHLNSWFGPDAKGAESYFLSRQASDERAAEVAAAENPRFSGGDAELDLQLILWDLAQSYHLTESQRFASLVQEELNAALDMGDRGVKQAPFRVLMGANMPAVVVELGFLSNPKEAARLQDPAYRAELVEALLRAVLRFKAQIEARKDLGETSP